MNRLAYARPRAFAATGAPLMDTFGRMHDNLRIGVTDRCNIRCFYCMPEDGVQFQPRQEILSFEEITRVARVSASLGVRKLRITGGEPLVRKDLPHLVRMLTQIPDLRDVALTTNAVLLKHLARPLREAGLHRLNIHLDTLDRDRFHRITRRDDLARVLEGIDAAQDAGFPIKLNAVAVKGLSEQDVVPLVQFGRERGMEVRFIEFMPLDAQGLWNRRDVLSAEEILRLLRDGIGPLDLVPDQQSGAPAAAYRFRDGLGRVGVIASVTQPFCASCNRVRLTADGKLRYCLFAVEETDLRPILRSEHTDNTLPSDLALASAIRDTVRQKWRGHGMNSAAFVPPPRPMYAIGG